MTRVIDCSIYPPVRGPGLDGTPHAAFHYSPTGANGCDILSLIAAQDAHELTGDTHACIECDRVWHLDAKRVWRMHAPLRTTPMRTTLRHSQSERPRWMRDRAQR